MEIGAEKFTLTELNKLLLIISKKITQFFEKAN